VYEWSRIESDCNHFELKQLETTLDKVEDSQDMVDSMEGASIDVSDKVPVERNSYVL